MNLPFILRLDVSLPEISYGFVNFFEPMPGGTQGGYVSILLWKFLE